MALATQVLEAAGFLVMLKDWPLNPDGSFWLSDEYGLYIYRYVLLFLI
jgi:hypothetical protein